MPTGPVFQRIAWTDPATLFRAGPGRSTHAMWLDAGADATAGWSWMGVGERAQGLPHDLTLSSGLPPVEVPGGFAGGWVGWATYDAAARRAGAPALDDGSSDAAIRVRRIVAFDHARREAWVIAEDGDLHSALDEVTSWSDAALAGEAPASTMPTRYVVADARHTPEEYAALIEQCRDAIRAGDAYQLCLTTRFSVPSRGTELDPVTTYLRLRESLPAHHGGFIRIGDRALLSASPEVFLQVQGGVVRTRPIKGTRPRGADDRADAALRDDLANSAKERAENVMIVDLMRNDLQRVCLPGTVAAERLLEVESYPAVHQLVSTVAGRLRHAVTLGDLLDAAFPAGSMTGAPKLSAMTILRGLEGATRGAYAGCFGWVGVDGRADLAMTIRSIIVEPGGAYVGAGGGITWLSRADEEVAEVGIKARGPLAALGATLPDGW